MRCLEAHRENLRVNSKKRLAPTSLQTNQNIKKKPRARRSKEEATSRGGSATAGTARDYPERSSYPFRSITGSRKRQGEESAATRTELRTSSYNLCSTANTRKSAFSSPEERRFVFNHFNNQISPKKPQFGIG
ncbi:hypothetical protein TNCV_2413871 [Trichonephila clavipes]|nr:hypothetical protein TNCV_2413871 [Trichonephila clavipes]